MSVCERKVNFSNCLSLSLVGVFAITVVGLCGGIDGCGGGDDDAVDAFYRSVLETSIDISVSIKTALQLEWNSNDE